MTEKPKDFKQIVRIADTDIKGEKSVLLALKQIKGVGFSIASAVCNVMGLDRKKKIGDMTDAQIKEMEGIVKNPDRLPAWMYNRRRDFETGESKHLLNVGLKLANEFDIKRLKKIRSYRGMRHSLGLPVRGQRTRSHFRSGRSIGVAKKAKVGKV